VALLRGALGGCVRVLHCLLRSRPPLLLSLPLPACSLPALLPLLLPSLISSLSSLPLPACSTDVPSPRRLHKAR
jgi:hypothetical protein